MSLPGVLITDKPNAVNSQKGYAQNVSDVSEVLPTGLEGLALVQSDY